jgi:hypothetical protein
VLCVIAALSPPGCKEGPDSGSVPGAARIYDGDFECTEIDGDTALLIWDPQAREGSFGWVPANSRSVAFVSMPITSLKFDVVFADVVGLDLPDVAETVRLRFDLTMSSDGKVISGPGTLTRASAMVEPCTALFRERAYADAGGRG